MEAVLQPQPRHANLLLHCGAHAVDREIIGTTSTPEPTITWTPIAHMGLVEEVEVFGAPDEQRHFAVVDAVGVGDDEAGLGLAEDER